MKETLLAALILTLSGTNIIAPQSQVIKYPSIDRGETIMPDNTAVFDLSILDKNKSILINTIAGEEATITLERNSRNEVSQISKALKDDTYTISYNSLTEKISYKISIRNNLITSIHSGSYSVFGYSVNSTSLKLNSSKNASYILNCSFLFRSWTNSLNSRITGENVLEVSLNG